MFLPALTLTLAYLGEYAIVMRSSLLDTMREDYLVLARAKGLRDVLVRNRHAVPNALLPVVALMAINFGFVLSGAIAVEAIFSWPGLGLASYEALQGSRPADAAGAVPRVQRGGDRLQPDRRPALRLPRPAGAERMNAVAAPSPRQITWQRRRRALAAAWRDFRRHRPGMVGPRRPRADRADGAGRAAARRRVGPAGDQHDREPGLGEPVGVRRRSAPTTSAAAS